MKMFRLKSVQLWLFWEWWTFFRVQTILSIQKMCILSTSLNPWWIEYKYKYSKRKHAHAHIHCHYKWHTQCFGIVRSIPNIHTYTHQIVITATGPTYAHAHTYYMHNNMYDMRLNFVIYECCAMPSNFTKSRAVCICGCLRAEEKTDGSISTSKNVWKKLK